VNFENLLLNQGLLQMLPTFKKFNQLTKFSRISYFPQKSFSSSEPTSVNSQKIPTASDFPPRQDPLADIHLGPYSTSRNLPVEDYAKSGLTVEKPFVGPIASPQPEIAGSLSNTTNTSARPEFNLNPEMQEKHSEKILQDFENPNADAEADDGGFLLQHIDHAAAKSMKDKNFETDQYKSGYHKGGEPSTEKVSDISSLNQDRQKQFGFGGSSHSKARFTTSKGSRFKSEKDKSKDDGKGPTIKAYDKNATKDTSRGESTSFVTRKIAKATDAAKSVYQKAADTLKKSFGNK
jgi:hypothetical protein